MRYLKLIAGVSALALSTPAMAQSARDVLPIPPAPFSGTIAEDAASSRPMPIAPVRAPAGAPNIFLFMSDDVGFAMSSTFGGPVPTPNMERIARTGQRYNRFHTTALCSPTRAALLTGRNHHNAATGNLSDLAAGYPGYDAQIPASTATIAQTLRLNGYNTAMFGKHHNVRGADRSAAGPFDMWPTGLGFEYFFGFNGGDSDQYRPNLYRGTSLLPTEPGKPVLFERRMADDAITWARNQRAAAPDKPFFLYYAPGSMHAPHQAPPEYIARFKGRFDQGWDHLREESYRHQLALGILPPGTRLTPRPPEIAAWSSLSPDQKRFAIASMEVAAGMLAYQDEQLGRVLAELERMGALDDTLVVLIEGDNGASKEGGASGTVNELQKINGMKEDDAWLAANAGRLGGEDTYPNYPTGVAWAFNAPFPGLKGEAARLGGIRNGMILSWPRHVARPAAICAEFGHVVDIAPTLFEAAGIPAPDSVYGVRQKPLDGQSLLPSLAACRPDRPRTQYFEMGGSLGLYHDGWFASRPGGGGPGEEGKQGEWELYDLQNDFSQSHDVAAANPDRMKAMIALFDQEARRNNVYPIGAATMVRRSGAAQPTPPRIDFWGSDVSIPAMGAAFPRGASFRLDAEFDLAKPQASGVIAALASHFAGWSLYLDRGRPTFVYARSTNPKDVYRFAAPHALPAGPAKLRLAFTAGPPNGAAAFRLFDSDREILAGAIPTTFLTPAGLGEQLDVGRDTGVPVTRYRIPMGRLEGEIRHVWFTFGK